MPYWMHLLFSFSIGIAAVLAAIRFPTLSSGFLPFVLLLWTGFLNELGSFLLIRNGYSNAVLYNLYSLTEAFLVSWQFARWGLFGNRRLFYHGLLVCYFVAWCFENLIWRTPFAFNSYFSIGYSFVVVMMAIATISEMLFFENYRLWRHAKFLICMAFVVFYSYALFVELFWLVGWGYSQAFRVRIYEILSCVNFFTNLIFILAVLWAPMKLRSIMQWS